MNGILYLMTGHKHACRLITSLATLREHYEGPVCLLSIDPERDLDKAIANESRLDVQVKKIEIKKRLRKNGSYVLKSSMWKDSPFQKTLFLDADTIIVKDLPSELWPIDDEVVVTQFSRWVSNRRPISRRLARWKEFAPSLCQQSLLKSYPAINTGVIGFSKKSRDFLGMWQELTARNPSFICDELSAQLIYPHTKHRVMSDRFNASPIYRDCEEEDVVIWHFHGSKHLKGKAVDIWFPKFTEVVEMNLANVRSFLPAGDRRLKSFIRSHHSRAETFRRILADNQSQNDRTSQDRNMSV